MGTPVAGACVSLALLVLFSLAPVGAQECSSFLSKPVYAAFKPVVEHADLCRHLKTKIKVAGLKIKLAVDKTARVSLDALDLCLKSPNSQLTATVSITCEASPSAAVHVSLSEKFDLSAAIDIPACKLVDLHIDPHGDIGKLIVANTNYTEKVKAELQKNLQNFCGH